MELIIGEFARLAQISVQTLRYYDSINLLKPELVDQFTNYRYYDLTQLSDLSKIMAYKDLGFSLEEISVFINQNSSTSDLKRLLQLKRKDLNLEIEEQLERVERIDTRIRIMDSESSLPTSEIIIKKIQPIKVVSLRKKIPSYWDVSPLWEKLYKDIIEEKWKTSEPNLTLFHSADPDIDVEVCVPVVSKPEIDHKLLIETELPEYETAACYVHQGPFGGISSAFTNLVKWIDLNNYSIVGPDREVYLRLPDQCKFDTDPNAITELQVPITRKSAVGVN